MCFSSHIKLICYSYIRINEKNLESYGQHQSYFLNWPFYIAYAKHRNFRIFPAVTISFYLYLVHKKKKRNLESLDDLKYLFYFYIVFFKGCLKANIKISLLRTSFYADPWKKKKIRIQMYIFYWVYSTINLSILNKYKIEKVQKL